MKPNDQQNKNEDGPDTAEKPKPNPPENQGEADLEAVDEYLRSPGYGRAADLLKKSAKNKPETKR